LLIKKKENYHTKKLLFHFFVVI